MNASQAIDFRQENPFHYRKFLRNYRQEVSFVEDRLLQTDIVSSINFIKNLQMNKFNL